MGRFMQPDEAFNDQNTRDPQSWNLYSYVRNYKRRSKNRPHDAAEAA